MKTIVAIFFICSTFCSFASLAPSKNTNAFNHLSEINKEWIANAHLAKNRNISFKNDTERIRYHLLEVETILRSKNNSHLTTSQLQKRLEMLTVLHQYAVDMQFPQNTYHSNRQPYFIDSYGTHCAVGYLVMKSGHGDISKSISQTQNYAYVREIDSPELIEWSIEYGFTVDELAWIQPGYPDSRPFEKVGGGTNGRVFAIEHSQSEGRTFVAGDFTMLGDVLCNNVAVYDGTVLSCLGGGLIGIVNDLKVQTDIYGANKGVFVVGKFQHNGNSYPIAKWENDEWEYFSVTNTSDNAIGTAIYSDQNSVQVGIHDGNEYFVSHKHNNSFFKGILVNGPIYAIASVDGYKLMLGGKFDKIYHSYTYMDIEHNVFNIQDTIETKNIAILDFEYFPPIEDYMHFWKGVTSSIPDTVFAIASVGLNTYVGGSGNSTTTDNIILSRITHNVAQPVIEVLWGGHQKICDISVNMSSNNLLLAGKISDISNGMSMVVGKNLFTYNLITGDILSAGFITNTVYSVSSAPNFLMIGGDFTTGINGAELLHLAKYEGYLNVEDLSEQTNFSLFPNPVTSEFQLSNVENAMIEITDVQGKTVLPSFEYKGVVNVEHLPSGVYIVKVQENQSIGTVRFVKN